MLEKWNMRYCRALLGIGVLCIAALIIGYKFLVAKVPDKLLIATGRNSGAYYKFALLYKEALRKEGIELTVIQTAGSRQALELLNENKVDIAFVQGGTAKEYQNRGMISLASLFYEPLWVFYRDGMKLNYLNELKSKRVSIGEEGSGTKPLFRMLLEENGVDTQNLHLMSDRVALQKLKNYELDALCLVVSPKAPIIKELLNINGIKLMNFNRQLAYKDKYDFIDSVYLNEGVMDLSQNIPSENINLLATTASLVVKEDFNHNLQKLFIKTIKPIHEKGGIFEKRGVFPSTQFVELPMSEHTKSYLENGETWRDRYLPLWLSSLVEILLFLIVPLIPIMFIVIKVVIPSYSLYFRHKLYLWNHDAHNLELEIDGDFEREAEAIMNDILRLKERVKRSCIIYFFYTQHYYNLMLKLNVLKYKLKQSES